MRILLDRILTRKNLSIRQVSILTGVPRSTIDDIITGKRSPPPHEYYGAVGKGPECAYYRPF